MCKINTRRQFRVVWKQKISFRRETLDENEKNINKTIQTNKKYSSWFQVPFFRILKDIATSYRFNYFNFETNPRAIKNFAVDNKQITSTNNICTIPRGRFRFIFLIIKFHLQTNLERGKFFQHLGQFSREDLHVKTLETLTKALQCSKSRKIFVSLSFFNVIFWPWPSWSTFPFPKSVFPEAIHRSNPWPEGR